ncbi:lanthionine synthetase C family protein [Nocardioides sp. KC13]|uniref:Lanthionine synthetase C family protein n=1 Tax=Nocardioides turkmenicus TaxID=2711220 RepID=A0A6M1QPU2_9ACTN|nr:lanthionine synthetase C family protein [Nocardioides sp. KC13]
MSTPDLSRQSLTAGILGDALLTVEQAHRGQTSWQDVMHQLRAVTSTPIDTGPDSCLYYGGPALLFVLHSTTADGVPRFETARATLTDRVRSTLRRRLDSAEARTVAGDFAAFGEYDLFNGHVGYATLLRVTAAETDEHAAVLDYLSRLAAPQRVGDVWLPGWWVGHAPDKAMQTPGGHVNNGMAHGAAGILSALALAARDGHEVPGQRDAIEALTQWFARCGQDDDTGSWWPQWLTRDQIRHSADGPSLASRDDLAQPARPSWCYGTPGIARSLQLAAIVLQDEALQRDAERALTCSLRQLPSLTEKGICHGTAGLYQTVRRAAADAHDDKLAQHLPAIARSLPLAGDDPSSTTVRQIDDASFLTGESGVDLAALSGTADPAGDENFTRWDACLLLT